jgi:hypothetical protein
MAVNLVSEMRRCWISSTTNNTGRYTEHRRRRYRSTSGLKNTAVSEQDIAQCECPFGHIGDTSFRAHR